MHSKEVQKTCEKLIIWKSDVNYQINIQFVGEMALPVEFPSLKNDIWADSNGFNCWMLSQNVWKDYLEN